MSKTLAVVDQWIATIEDKVSLCLANMSDDALMGFEEVIRENPVRFVKMAPPTKKEFLGLCAYLAVARELKRRHEIKET